MSSKENLERIKDIATNSVRIATATIEFISSNIDDSTKQMCREMIPSKRMLLCAFGVAALTTAAYYALYDKPFRDDIAVFGVLIGTAVLLAIKAGEILRR